jgi:hypothetical protein
MFHFLNCMLLTFGPHVIMYRSTQLIEESALKSCAWAGLIYALSQVFKIFIMATFLPSVEMTEWTFVQEVMKSVVNGVELLGAHFALASIPNLSKFSHGMRILCVGLGWSFIQACVLYLLPLWLGARGMEFSWEFIEMGIAANIDMLLNMSMLACIWLRSRTDLERQGLPLVWVGLAVHLLMPSIQGYLTHVALVSSWNIQMFRLVIGLVLGVPVRMLIQRYSTHKVRAA